MEISEQVTMFIRKKITDAMDNAMMEPAFFIPVMFPPGSSNLEGYENTPILSFATWKYELDDESNVFIVPDLDADFGLDDFLQVEIEEGKITLDGAVQFLNATAEKLKKSFMKMSGKGETP